MSNIILEANPDPRKGDKWVVIINNERYNAEYMTTSQQLQEGMMLRKSLDGCMVFRLGSGNHTFWMKDCLIPLDIVFVANNKINKIYPNCPPDRKIIPTKYPGYGDHVIEFPAGTSSKFKVGDVVGMWKDTEAKDPTFGDRMRYMWNGTPTP